MKKLLALLSVSSLAACGGGSGTSLPPAPAPYHSTVPVTPSPKPTSTAKASPKPSPAPSATATTAGYTVNAAPAGSKPGSVSASRLRKTKGLHTQQQGISQDGLTVLVDSTGPVSSLWSADIAVWLTDNATGLDIPETSATATGTNGLLINEPAPQPACLTQDVVTQWCDPHPTAWDFGVEEGPGRPIGQQTITITYGDGKTAQFIDDIYPSFGLMRDSGITFNADYTQGTVSDVTSSDIYADADNQNLIFPYGAILLSQPVPDQFGNENTLVPTILTGQSVPATQVVMPMSSIIPSAIYLVNTSYGGQAKVFFLGTPSIEQQQPYIGTGYFLSTSPGGTFAF